MPSKYPSVTVIFRDLSEQEKIKLRAKKLGHKSLSNYFRRLAGLEEIERNGSPGGVARAESMSGKRRSQIASNAARARHRK